jgi:predicted DNA-binding transcriptional regulator AlpA
MTTETDPDDATRYWMTIRQIADELSISASTAYKWSARGGQWFPKAIRLRNGDVRIRRDWYEAWLAEQPMHNGPAPKVPVGTLHSSTNRCSMIG